MIEYIKTVILAILTGATAPLPVSSAAHFSFLANVIGVQGGTEIAALYYNGFLVAFSLVVIISFRKIFIGCLKSAFVSKKDKVKYESHKGHRFIFKNIGLSLIPTVLLFVPVSKGKLMIDFFNGFLGKDKLLLSGFACIITALILVIALWYSRNKTNREESSGPKAAFRLSLYQLPCYIIPGFSHVASGAVNLIICDAKEKTFIRELYVYLAPSMLIVGLVQLIRTVASGLLFDPVTLVLGMVVFGVVTKLVISSVLRTNIRRLFGFFCIYSILYGMFIAVASFLI